MICATLSVTYDQFRKSSSFSLIEDGPVHPLLKEVIKDTVNHLTLVFIEFSKLWLWVPPAYFWVISLS